MEVKPQTYKQILWNDNYHHHLKQLTRTLCDRDIYYIVKPVFKDHLSLKIEFN